MRVHHLQHVPFEGLGSMEAFFESKGYQLSSTLLYDSQPLPPVEEIDWLIVMGGPMGVFDENIYPWLKEEKRFIKEAIESGKIVLGICLGAQLIADVLGAKIYKNDHREIGWFEISLPPSLKGIKFQEVIPDKTEVFHWHGDTFDLPEGAIHLAESEACKNQAFLLNDRIIGLQFHLETTVELATALIGNCRDELDGSEYVQSEHEILADTQKFLNINRIMNSILEVLGKL